MPERIQPRAVAPGATLALAAPGGPVDPERLAAGVAGWREAGFQVVHRDDLLARQGYLAGDDARRVDELASWVADPAVDAIVCARGGYGCDRILDRLDAGAFRRARKPLVGYSDVTALLLWQERCAGLTAFHGPMLDGDAASLRLAAELLTGRARVPYELAGRGHGGGGGEGRLVGGNLMLVTASIGTAWEVDTQGAILMLEEVNERPYRLDRMLQQLRGAGKLEGLVGLGAGDLSSCCDERYPEPDALAVLAAFAAEHGLPLVSGLPFGHALPNHAWPTGARATIDADRGTVRVLESGVGTGVADES